MRFGRFSVAFGRVLFASLILIQVAHRPAAGQSATLAARICVRDEAGNAALADATVTARNETASPVTGVTANDGCVALNVPLATSTGVDDGALPADAFATGSPFPHPVSDGATIPFAVPDARYVSFSIYDLLGRQVGPGIGQMLTPGAYGVQVDMAGLRPGLYLYRLDAGAQMAAGRVLKLGEARGAGEATAHFTSGSVSLSARSASAFAAATLQIDVQRAGYAPESMQQLVEEGQDVTVMLAKIEGTANQMIPLDMMGPNDTYYGLKGGLVDNGTPTVETADGKIIIIAISMSNGFQEFSRFIDLYEGHPDVSDQIVLINCAVGGSALERWLSEQTLWDRCKDNVTQKYQLNQVRVVWAKDANQDTADGITLPDAQADYYDLIANIGALSQKIGQEFPSVQAVFHTSRIYGGYVEDLKQGARGEPISYEGGFAVNAVIEKWKAGQLPGSPWIGWGPYVWAKGEEIPNASGITWTRLDYQGTNGDNQHPSEAGAKKVADALHAFFMQFPWYKR
ncbi:MAG: hypothetical protein R2834_10560 [Rhodothermales bacterium]